MKITILTLFPDMFTGPFEASIVKRAQKQHRVEIAFVNLRTFANDKYKTVDGRPYGGGVGMIMRVDVVDRALTQIAPGYKILLDAAGPVYTQDKARKLSEKDHIILICGHYEGVDERVKTLVDEEISIGPYVLTGGEIPAMVLTDSIVRLIPGVLKHPEATLLESFTDGRLEYPQYTEPREYKGMIVPHILLSGHHAKIQSWKNQKSTEKTRKSVSG